MAGPPQPDARNPHLSEPAAGGTNRLSASVDVKQEGVMMKAGRWGLGFSMVLLAASSALAKGGHDGDPQKRLDNMAKKLELTTEQRGQVEQIMTDYRGRIQTLQDQVGALKQEKHEKIKAVLNPAQQEKFSKMKHKKAGGWFRKRAN